MGCDLTPPPGLFVSGLCAEGGATVALISPDEPQFWRLFTAAPEAGDGRPDPMDRWSKRVIGDWAGAIGARAVFPSDGPPFAPFTQWALASGRCWTSPLGMLVHERMGLFISFRGALILDSPAPQQPPAGASPCQNCPHPCLTACPAGAFRSAYEPARCHDWLDRDAGQDCMSQGCLARRACPLAKYCGRLPEQSAWHMRHFHP